MNKRILVNPTLTSLLLLFVGKKACLGWSSFSSPVHTLLLCRHGDSVWNGGQIGCHERFTGWTDAPLSQKGLFEAVLAGEQVASYAYRVDGCFTSILGRAQETAEHVLRGFAREQHNDRVKIPAFCDYRLNERHYGALQGYVKKEVEDGLYGHDKDDVEKWRRSWHVVPPLLEDGDDRREDEVRRYGKQCGGARNVPKGESLEMVARDRLRPFLDRVLTPFLDKAAEADQSRGGGTGLIVAHANSLRALLGVVCEVERNPAALTVLEALKIPTGVPLVLKYRRSPETRKYQVMDLPQADECIVDDYFDGPGLAQRAPPDLGHPDLPVWPLNACIPVQQPQQRATTTRTPATAAAAASSAASVGAVRNQRERLVLDIDIKIGSTRKIRTKKTATTAEKQYQLRP